MPVQAVLQLSMNCLTGLVIWRDDLGIENTITYSCVYFLIIIGVHETSAIDVSLWNSQRIRLTKSVWLTKSVYIE